MELSITDTRLFGEIVTFNHEKHFGFIRTQEGESYFFYQSEENFMVDMEEGLILKRYYANVGDIVSFCLRPNFREDDPPVAAGLIRMGNFHRLNMIRMGKKQDCLIGTLLAFGKTFRIRHRETKALVNVVLSPSSKDPEQWLTEKLGCWVKFKLTHNEDEEKVNAYVMGIPIRNGVKRLLIKMEAGELVQGKVVHRSNAGITLFLSDHYLNGNLSIKSATTPEEIAYFENIKMGQMVSAYPIEYNFEKGLVKMDFFRPRESTEIPIEIQVSEDLELQFE
ncbi:hypothetical protein [Algoriphagus mannitolivorans]|uniref:hypothetical protein n=1 Tax=Algoriphagus mannitolivorans TaxID=226504 RepID=UPI0004053690|nr:hypothetical protein [Algoriphagus mannitolivorans]